MRRWFPHCITRRLRYRFTHYTYLVLRFPHTLHDCWMPVTVIRFSSDYTVMLQRAVLGSVPFILLVYHTRLPHTPPHILPGLHSLPWLLPRCTHIHRCCQFYRTRFHSSRIWVQVVVVPTGSLPVLTRGLPYLLYSLPRFFAQFTGFVGSLIIYGSTRYLPRLPLPRTVYARTVIYAPHSVTVRRTTPHTVLYTRYPTCLHHFYLIQFGHTCTFTTFCHG